MPQNKISAELRRQIEKLRVAALVERIRIMVELATVPTAAQLDVFRINYEAETVYKSKVRPYVSMIVNSNRVLEIAELPWVKKVWHVPEVRLVEVHVPLVDVPQPALAGATEVTLMDSAKHLTVDVVKDLGYKGEGIRIAVVDSGIDTVHPMLAGKVIAEKHFIGPDPGDRYGHGTYCASIAAGFLWDSAIGPLEGMAPNASIINAKAFETGSTTNDITMAALEWAVTEAGAQICSCSWGALDPYEPWRELIATLKETYGTIFVFAAGNDGPGSGTICFPGAYEECISVGSIAVKAPEPNAVAYWSSRGPKEGRVKPDIMAPGGTDYECLIAAWIGGQLYTCARGTSASTPHIAGSLALLLQRGFTPEEVASRLYGTATDLLATGKDNDSGFGVANVFKAMDIAPPQETYVLTITSKPASIPFMIDGVSYVTPWSEPIPWGEHIIEMLESATVGARTYHFARWGDGTKTRTRTIMLLSDTTFEALFYEFVATIVASDDAYTNSGSPDANFGAEETIDVGQPEGVIRRGFLKFDLREIPPEAEVMSAELHMFFGNWTEGYSQDVQFREIEDDSWTQQDITWNNQPPYGGSITIHPATSRVLEWWIHDVSNYILKELAGNEIASFCLKVIDETIEKYWGLMHFFSKERGREPFLKIFYLGAPLPTHTLTVKSQPIEGVPVTVDEVPVGVTPVSSVVEEGEHIIKVTEEIIIE